MHKIVDETKWEDICDKCGKCCYEKIDLGGGVIKYTDVPCEHLDTETNLCKIYANRGEIEPDCITLTQDLVRSLHWLPEHCAYLQYVRHHDTLARVRAIEESKRKKRRLRRRR